MGLVVTDSYMSEHNGLTHVYLAQTVNGIEVTNGVANVHIANDGSVLSFASSFWYPDGLGKEDSSYLSKSYSTDDSRRNSQQHRVILQDNTESTTDYLSRRNHDHQSNSHSKRRKKSKKHLKSKLHNNSKENSKVASLFDSENHNMHNINNGPNDKNVVMLNPVQAIVSFSSFIGIQIEPDSIELTPFVSLKPPSRTDPELTLQLEVYSSQNHFRQKRDGTKKKISVPASMKYIQTSEGSLASVWDFQVDLDHAWYHAHVDAVSGETLSLVNWVADASYTVWPLGVNDPQSGSRETVFDPSHPLASPNGWHSIKKKNYTVTLGNNVFAHENLDGKNNVG